MNSAAAQSLAPAADADTAVAQESGPRLQRKCACSESDASCERCSGGARPKLQRKAIGAAASAAIPAHAHAVISSPGLPLDARTRSVMEPRLGFDFSNVRIHSDARAQASARSLNAAAYTVGTNVVLGDRPAASRELRGDGLMAHELAHVVQQSRPGTNASDTWLEREADDAATAVTRGSSFTVRGSAGPAVQRAPAEGGAKWKQFAVDRVLGLFGLNSTSSKLLLAGMEGCIEGFSEQWNKGGTGQRLRERLGDFGLMDAPKFLEGYVVGLLEGIVSPITDLFQIGVMLEQLRNFGLTIAASAISRRGELKAELDGLLATLDGLAEPVRKVINDMKQNKLRTLKQVLEFANSQGGMMEKAEGMAKSVGHAGGVALAGSFDEKKEEKKDYSLKTETLQAINDLVGRGRDKLIFGEWGKVGNKAGYIVGMVAVQVALLVFSEGIGNAITSIGKALGGIAKAGTFLGRTLEGIGKFVQAAGAFIKVIEGGVDVVMGVIMKPLMPILEPVMRPFGSVMKGLQKFLQKLFGVAEKEAAPLATAVVSKTEGALSHALPTPHAPTPHAPTPPPHAPTVHAPTQHAPAPAAHAPTTHAPDPHAPATTPATKPHDPAPAAARDSAPAPKQDGAPALKQDTAPAPKHDPAPAPKQDATPAPKQDAAPAPKQDAAPTPKQDAPPAATHDAPAADKAAMKPKDAPGDGGKVVAEAPTADPKHHTRVRENGDIELCSDEPCPLLEHMYKDIIGGSEPLSREMAAIKKLRANKADPQEIARRSAALQKELEAIRKKSTPNPGDLDRAVADFKKTMADETGVTPDDITSKPRGKTSGSTASKDKPLEHDVGMNVDENKPVGERTPDGKRIHPDEARSRALDPNNRDIKEALNNQSTKYLGVDQRELDALAKPRDPVSLAVGTGDGKRIGKEHLTLFDRRFSEITETKEISEEILKTIEGQTTRAPGKLKEEFNRKFWDVVRNPNAYEGKLRENGLIVAEALERSGFGVVKAPNGQNVMRQLTQREMLDRGFIYNEFGGWVRPGAPR